MVARRLLRWIRALPIAWRIPLVVALNLFVALAVGGLGWHAAVVTSHDIDELRRVQRGTVALYDLDTHASRMQGLVRHYLADPSDDLLKEAMRASEELFVLMGEATSAEPVPPGDDAVAMHEAARRFVAGFQNLKMVNAEIARLYESQVHQTIGEISGLYAILNSTARTRGGGELAPALVKSHENFVGTLIAVNAFSFDGNATRADEARDGLTRMTESIPVLTRIADSDLQRDALGMLAVRARVLTVAIDELARNYEERGRILSTELDPSQATMSAAIERLIADSREREETLRQRSHDQLSRMAVAGAVGAVGLLVLGGWISAMIGWSIRRPLLDLHAVMEAGAGGDWSRAVEDSDLNDELAAMARTIEVFRRHATEKSRLERERAEDESRAEAANRRALHDLLSEMEAHDSSGSFVAPPTAADTASEAGEVAAVFTRILARFHAATGERDARIVALTAEAEAARAEAQGRADFFIALAARLRPRLDSLGTAAWPVLDQLDAALDYIRLEQGEPPPTPCPVDLAKVIAAAIAFAQAGARTVRIEVRLDPGLPPRVRLDPVWLARLLGLLLDHAAAAATGQVRVFADRMGPDRPYDPPRLRLWVVDDGDGAAEALAPLLRPSPAADVGDLRLALARLLVTRLGGTVGGEVLAGVGGAVWCVVPLDPAEEADPIRAEADCLIGKRVLVVAPDPDERGLIALVTEQAGAAVVRVPGGREALAASARANASRSPFDLVVAATLALDPDQRDSLGAVPLVLIDDGDPRRRLALSRGPVCPMVIGRPLGRDQVLSAADIATRRGATS